MTPLRRIVVAAVLLIEGCAEDEPVETEPISLQPRPVAHTAAGRESCVALIVPAKTVDLTSDVDGRLQQLDVSVGQVVERDQFMARLDDSVARERERGADASLSEAQADVIEARVRRDDAKRELDELKSLAARGAVPKHELRAQRSRLHQVNAELRAAVARVDRAKARSAELRTELASTQIVAPFDARVHAVFMDEGAFVRRGEPIVKISSPQQHVRFAASVHLTGRLAVGQTVWVQPEGVAHTVPATVVEIAPEVEPATQTIFVEAALDDLLDQFETPLSGHPATVVLQRPSQG